MQVDSGHATGDVPEAQVLRSSAPDASGSNSAANLAASKSAGESNAVRSLASPLQLPPDDNKGPEQDKSPPRKSFSPSGKKKAAIDVSGSSESSSDSEDDPAPVQKARKYRWR